MVAHVCSCRVWLLIKALIMLALTFDSFFAYASFLVLLYSVNLIDSLQH